MPADEISKIFHPNKALGSKEKELGAKSWLYLIVSALNSLDSHGNCVSYYGPPSLPQARALDELLEDCRIFVADEKAMTPVDFNKELGGKLHAYWGEPVYTAQDLTLLQVRPTLPAKGIAASVEIT